MPRGGVISIKLFFFFLIHQTNEVKWSEKGEKGRRGEGGRDIHKTLFAIQPRYLGDFPFARGDPQRFTSVQRSEQRNVVVPLVRHDVEVSRD